jgi:hypothetical protein
VDLVPAQVVRPGTWIDVVIVALLPGIGAFLNGSDWHTRFLTRMRTAREPMGKEARDAVMHVRPKRVRPQAQPLCSRTSGC